MSSATEDITDDEASPEDIDAEDTPIGSLLLDRPEVHEVSINFGHECVIVLVQFETWSIPSDFARQYDMHLSSASIVDPRPRWKQVFGIGRSAFIEGRFIRDGGGLR